AALEATAEVAAASSGRADNAEAHRLYLQGRFYRQRITQEDLARAIGYYEQAIALEPDFAHAWAGLSDALGMQTGYGWVLPGEGSSRARRWAEKAIELAPDLADGHARLGEVLVYRDWNWEAGEVELRRAIELAPNDPEVLCSLGTLLDSIG